MERIQKLIARAGIASRRDAEDLIKQQRVRVNGHIAELGQQASADDRITVDGKPIALEKQTYYALHKPRGYVTTLGQGTHTMRTLIQKNKINERVYPAGRLDKDAQGLIILTNDGDFANIIMHPRYELSKEYHITLDKPFAEPKGTLKQVRIDGKKIQIARVMIDGRNVRLQIHEGRKHIVKRIFRQLGYAVTRLIRTRIGPIQLGTLPPGKTRPLTTREINTIKRTED